MNRCLKHEYAVLYDSEDCPVCLLKATNEDLLSVNSDLNDEVEYQISCKEDYASEIQELNREIDEKNREITFLEKETEKLNDTINLLETELDKLTNG